MTPVHLTAAELRALEVGASTDGTPPDQPRRAHRNDTRCAICHEVIHVSPGAGCSFGWHDERLWNYEITVSCLRAVHLECMFRRIDELVLGEYSI